MLWTDRYSIAPSEIDRLTDKIILPPSVLEQLLRLSPDQELPHPLTFSISTGSMTSHCGVREFSAEEGYVLVPSVILDNLAAKPGEQVKISYKALEKGERVRLRPLESGYDHEDWKALLESSLRSMYTTLTKGQVLKLGGGMRFLVDDVQPADVVCIVDTDLEVDIEPLSERQAVETLKSKTHKKAQTISVEDTIESVGHGYTRFVLPQWNRHDPVRIELSSPSPDVDLLASVNEDPILERHIFSNLSPTASKNLTIWPTNSALLSDSTLYIAVHCPTSAAFLLHISQGSNEEQMIPGSVRCDNCLTQVPERSLFLHQNHCRRNNVRCKLCDHVSRRGTEEIHWHCSDCLVHGEGSLDAHTARFHTLHTCICDETFPSITTLAYHRETECPVKSIKCAFCHLSVAQGDARLLSYKDASLGLTAHEVDCGSRTIECESCRRLVRIRDIQTHMKIHDSQRLTHHKPVGCINENCTRTRSDNALGLCAACFGPLYNAQVDTDGKKLQMRIQRRYVTQLMTGCKRSSCKNRVCATATATNLTYTNAVKKSAETIESGKVWFCVDETTEKRRTSAELLECDGSYELAWCCRAMEEAHGDIEYARRWLEREAIKCNER